MFLMGSIPILLVVKRTSTDTGSFRLNPLPLVNRPDFIGNRSDRYRLVGDSTA